jgi:hypothetical protein
VGYSGNYSSNWMVWPMHVETKDFQISDIGTLYNTQTFTVRPCPSLIPLESLLLSCSPACLHHRAAALAALRI